MNQNSILSDAAENIFADLFANNSEQYIKIQKTFEKMLEEELDQEQIHALNLRYGDTRASYDHMARKLNSPSTDKTINALNQTLILILEKAYKQFPKLATLAFVKTNPEAAADHILQLEKKIEELTREKTQSKNDYDEEVLCMPIDKTKLTKTITIILERNNMTHLIDLVQKTREEMMAIPNFTRIFFRETEEILRSKGLGFWMRLDEATVASVREKIKANGSK